MDISRLISKLREQDFGPGESVIASTVMNPKLAASKAVDWFAGQMARATNTPDPYDNPTPLRGYTPEEQVEGAFNLAGLAQTGALPMAPSGAGTVGSIKAFHGSPHKFEQFDMSKIGTGEGAQAYGHGLYFADSPEVAKMYQKELSNFYEPFLGERAGSELSDMDLDVLKALEIGKRNAGQFPHNTVYYAKKYAENKPELLSALGELPSDVKFGERLNRGNFYETSLEWPDPAREASDPLSPEHFLQWDKPLSEQPDVIQDRFSSLKPHNTHLTSAGDPYQSLTVNGSDVYNYLSAAYKDSEKASKLLKGLDIPGIRYLDQGSRGAGGGTHNYVVFDDQIPKIVEINGQPVDVSNLANKLRGE